MKHEMSKIEEYKAKKKTAPDCYKCKWRRNIPGDAHSMCFHPEVQKLAKSNNPISVLVETMAGEHIEAVKKLGIVGDRHGVARGWFMWPSNFDPTWLRECNGFEAKDKQDDSDIPF